MKAKSPLPKKKTPTPPQPAAPLQAPQSAPKINSNLSAGQLASLLELNPKIIRRYLRKLDHNGHAFRDHWVVSPALAQKLIDTRKHNLDKMKSTNKVPKY